MSKKDNGGPAFPAVFQGDTRSDASGLSMRDYFAANAPVDFGMAGAVWGDDMTALHDDRTRAAFFAVWAMLRYEWADAMLAARGDQ